MSHVTSVALQRRYRSFQTSGLKLDITRGKPSVEQNRLSRSMLEQTATISPSGVDCMDYGEITGLKEASALFSPLLRAPKEQTFVFGGGSLALMQGLIAEAMLRPLPGNTLSWSALSALSCQRPAILCPVPWYDRHDNIHRLYAIDTIPVSMDEYGPVVDEVRAHLRDPRVVAMWCIGKHHNPTGITYPLSRVRELAALQVPRHFRFFFDQAYAVHDHREFSPFHDVLSEFANAGHVDNVWLITSTSKLTYPDGGLGIVAASASNMDWVRESQFARSIGTNKLLQLQHVLFLRDMEGILAHSRRHMNIIRPKFDLVDEILSREFDGRGVASLTKTSGGYFRGVHLSRGSAENVVALCASAGLKVTPASACGVQKFIRIAPTYPPMEQLRPALELFATCVLLDAERL